MDANSLMARKKAEHAVFYSSDINMNSDDHGVSFDLTANAVLSEKQLVLVKKPKGHSETVAVLAGGRRWTRTA
jgi:hypothetical protein